MHQPPPPAQILIDLDDGGFIGINQTLDGRTLDITLQTIDGERSHVHLHDAEVNALVLAIAPSRHTGQQAHLFKESHGRQHRNENMGLNARTGKRNKPQKRRA